MPINIDINESLWTERFGANETSLRFISKNMVFSCELTECISP